MRINTRKAAFECVFGDIAEQRAIEVVVNAANARLLPGGGVAGALHRAAGPELAEACAPLAPIDPGQAVITDALDLSNRFVIHCLGPQAEPAAELLAECYANALRIAEEKGVSSIAFPAISTHAFGYPIQDGAQVACSAVLGLAPDLRSVQLVRFVLYDQPQYQAFGTALVHAIAVADMATATRY